MDRTGAAALFRGDRDLATLLSAADDLGGRGRSRLRHARAGRGNRRQGSDHRGRSKIPAQAWPNELIQRSQGIAGYRRAWRVITFARPGANAIDSPLGYGDIHAAASISRCMRIPSL